MLFNLRARMIYNDVYASFETIDIQSKKSKKLIDRIFKPALVLTQGLAKPIGLRKLEGQIRDGIHLLLQRVASQDIRGQKN